MVLQGDRAESLLRFERGGQRLVSARDGLTTTDYQTQNAACSPYPLGLLDREHRLKGLGLPSDALWERGADWPDFGLTKE